MLKGEDIVCGTSTTGTGTLTLANPPEPPGGVDFFAWLTTAGIGFVNGNVVLVPYTLKEYTDATFSKVKQTEVGWGTLTLGVNLGATTLARTTVSTTVTGEDAASATYSVATTAITIITASNVLVFIGPRAMDTIVFTPYFETTLGDNIGCTALSGHPGFNSAQASLPASGDDTYWPLIIAKPMLVKKVTMVVAVVSSGTSSAFFRLYAMNTTGRPGRLLCDYGALGGANPLSAGGNISTAVHATGFFVTPGEYIADLFATYSTGAPTVSALQNALHTGAFGVTSGTAPVNTTATGGSSTAPATANLTGYALGTMNLGPPLCTFKTS